MALDDHDLDNNDLIDESRLHRLEARLELPMMVLGLVWLGLLIIELTSGLSPWLETASLVIWGIFLLDFAVKFYIAPAKLRFLRQNILTMISLAVPALRIFRIARLIRLLRFSRAVRGIRLFRVITSLKRSMGSLSGLLGRRGFGYVMLFTLIVTLSGAAGIYAFENHVDHPAAPRDFWGALWWTSMLMTTVASEYWPQTIEGKILCLILSVYSVAVFGYIAGTIATFFIGQEAEDAEGNVIGVRDIERLTETIEALRTEVQSLREIVDKTSRE